MSSEFTGASLAHMATAVTGYRHLLVEIAPPTARITLDRPEKRNALSLELMEELVAASGRPAPNGMSARSSSRRTARRSPPDTTSAR